MSTSKRLAWLIVVVPITCNMLEWRARTVAQLLNKVMVCTEIVWPDPVPCHYQLDVPAMLGRAVGGG